VRIGFGIDIHKLEEGLPLVLGTVRIPHHKGCLAHSDGDVLVHAICDALLGAAGLEDIGHQFPDSDPAYKGINSSILLDKVVKKLEDHNYTIINIDTTVVLQTPKISPYIAKMKTGLAGILKIEPTQVSVKATTSEHLGFEGKEEGISAYAICLINNNSGI
jgi:2-C-methyl-D-erythritol 2,4-cyclodiphosphate synthase